MKKLRRVTEAEVIAEFLKNEFYQEEFHEDRETFEHVVLQADIANDFENALRKALLFRRRGHMWRELPADTQWWEVEINEDDMERIRVFPRAQWRDVANGDFFLKAIVHRIRTKKFSGSTRDFISKVQALSYRLRIEQDNSCVLLIGIDERHPFTILEGNHRLAAAQLADGDLVKTRFRILCGLSSKMDESCWYETNVPNLWRYAKNRMRNLWYDRDADIQRVLRSAEGRAANQLAVTTLEEAMPTRKTAPGSK